MIPFNKVPYLGTEDKFVLEALHQAKLSGDGPFGEACQQWFMEKMHVHNALLTPSCTHALEMSALLAGIKKGDEVIMPSYTFVSTANAFALRGATIVFVDIDKKTMNIDASKIEAAITERTVAIVPVHYAGVACDMDTIMGIARQYHLLVIEDAAQGMMSRYKGELLGSIGDMGCYSFHETKNYTSGGEGGILFVNDQKYANQAEIIREKGTDRSRFLRGEVDKYTWVSLGSSYLPSELQSAYLFAQLEQSETILEARLSLWDYYFTHLKHLSQQGKIELPTIPQGCSHNGHMFYIKTKDIDERSKLMAYLKQHGIMAVFHYIPLHATDAGKRYGYFHGEDTHTTTESERILRLPLYYGMTHKEQQKVIDYVSRFYQ